MRRSPASIREMAEGWSPVRRASSDCETFSERRCLATRSPGVARGMAAHYADKSQLVKLGVTCNWCAPDTTQKYACASATPR